MTLTPVSATSGQHSLLRDLADGRITEDEAIAALQKQGTPLVERVVLGEVDVTFVYVVDGSEESITVHNLATRHRDRECALIPVAGTRIWSATMRLPSNLRSSYWFDVVRSGDSGSEMTADPHNRWEGYGDPRLKSSVLELPDAAELQWLTANAETDVTRSADVHDVSSEQLGDTRRVWVSVPDGDAPEDGWPFVVVFDGVDGHVAPRVRDQLVASGTRPFAVVLVDPMDRREIELTANADYSRMLATELVPWLRERYALSANPQDAVVSGSSYGGVCAGFTALHHSDVFGGALMQSPSCWYHPEVIDAWRTKQPSRDVHIPTIIDVFSSAEPVPVRIWHECGAYEQGPPPAQIAQRLGNRWLHDVLVRRGYETEYSEFAGGHDAVWWRNGWGNGMRWLIDR